LAGRYTLPCAAGAAAAVFGVHPIHTEAVDSIFNRSEIQVTICVLVALLALWRTEHGHRVLGWSIVAVLYLVALFFRESALSLPVLALLMLVLMRAERVSARRLAAAGMLVIPLVVYLALRNAALADVPPPGTPPLAEAAPPAGFVDGLAFSLASFREYLRMVAWPHPLRVSYEDFAGEGWFSALVIHASLLGLGAVALRRSPGLTFGLAFFYLSLVPSTRLFTAPVQMSFGHHVFFRIDAGVTPLAERAVYLPSAGLAVMLAVGFAALGRHFGVRAIGALAFLLVVLLVPITWARNPDWRSERALSEAEIRAAPENGDAWRLYVGVLSGEGRHQEIAAVCDRHAAAHPRSPQLQNSCGVAYMQVGRIDDAVAAYRRAIDGGLATVGHANLGRAYVQMGRREEAELEFRHAAEAERDPAARHYRIGQMIEWFHPERSEEAAAEYRTALGLRPAYGAARDALGRMGAK